MNELNASVGSYGNYSSVSKAKEESRESKIGRTYIGDHWKSCYLLPYSSSSCPKQERRWSLVKN